MSRIQRLVFGLLGLTLSGALPACSSKPIVPEAENVILQREDVDPACQNLGPLEGRNADLRGDVEKALEDLRLEAARKGATHVRLETTSGLGNAARGTAFRCP